MPQMQNTSHAHISLALIHIWIYGDGKGTYSARILKDCLLSLAGKQEVRLSSLQALDDRRRIWISDVIFGLDKLSDRELLSAAGEPVLEPTSSEAQVRGMP